MNLTPLYEHLAAVTLDRSPARSYHRAGWYNTVTGEVMEVPSLSHFKEIAARPEYDDVRARLEEIQDEKDREYQAFCDAMEPDEHPAWHNWDMAEWAYDEMRAKAVRRVFEDGWIRWGVWVGDTRYAHMSKVEFAGAFRMGDPKEKIPDQAARYEAYKRPFETLAEDLGLGLHMDYVDVY